MLIYLKVKYSDNISDSLTVLSDDRFLRFLTLVRERVSNHMTQKGDVKHRMNLHEFRKCQRLGSENYMSISLSIY